MKKIVVFILLISFATFAEEINLGPDGSLTVTCGSGQTLDVNKFTSSKAFMTCSNSCVVRLKSFRDMGCIHTPTGLKYYADFVLPGGTNIGGIRDANYLSCSRNITISKIESTIDYLLSRGRCSKVSRVGF